MPNLFYIYDSRVVESMRLYISRIPKESSHLIKSDSIDTEYSKFFLKCFELQKQIEGQFDLKLTPRELDKVLIIKANRE